MQTKERCNSNQTVPLGDKHSKCIETAHLDLLLCLFKARNPLLRLDLLCRQLRADGICGRSGLGKSHLELLQVLLERFPGGCCLRIL